MDLNKILLVDNKNDTSNLKTQLTNEEICKDIITTDNGLEAIELLSNKDIDLVITNLTVKNVDGIGIIEKAKALELSTKFIVLSPLSNDEIIQDALSAGASYYLLKPCEVEIIVQRIRDVFKNREPSKLNEPDLSYFYIKNMNIDTEYNLEVMVTNAIHMVGIQHNLVGFSYLKEAIILATKNKEAINTITKELYPDIATLHKTSPSRVERAIRHAIENAWRRSPQAIMDFTKTTFDDKPTNSEFIALMADKIRLELKQIA